MNEVLYNSTEGLYQESEGRWLLWPRSTDRPVPQEVEKEIAEDFSEAVAVLNISPKASAALSRRCLQNLLVTKGGASSGKVLFDQIDEVLLKLPTEIAEQVDAIRNIGNFATHPIKSKVSGAIQDVEPGEAEWTLDVLELLFDQYYVRPAIIQKKKDALNQRLQQVGKKPLKKP